MKKPLIALVALVVVGLAWTSLYKGKVVPAPVATSTIIATSTDLDLTPVIPQEKVSTEGWKTCRNTELGYEFQYPKEWVAYSPARIEEENAYREIYKKCNGMFIGGTSFTLPNQQPLEGVSVSLDLIQPKDEKTIDEWFGYINKDRAPQQEYLLRKVYLIGGQRAFFRRLLGQGEVFNPGTDRVGDIQFVSPDKSVLFSIHGQWVTNPTLDPTLETILSTFKFIEKTPAH